MKIKRIIFIFFFTICTLLNTSCNDKKVEKFLLEGNYDISEVKKIEAYELINKIEANDSFLLYVSVYSCTSCASFNKNVLFDFIKETKSVIYNIDLSKIEDVKNENIPYIKESPTIVFYNKGVKVNTLSYLDNEDVFKNINDFKDYLLNYVIFPRIIQISEVSLDEKINTGEAFYLYIGWNKCGDCKRLNKRIINDYYKNNSKTIYYLECDEYRKNKPSTKPILGDNPTKEEMNDYNNYNKWLEFANKYSFSYYDDGKVPTLQYYANKEVAEMVVYLNDTINNNVITNSFYKDFINIIVEDDESLYKMHDRKILDFLNKYK